MSALKLNDQGPEVVRLQEKLAAAGFPPGPADGHFGVATFMALVNFQKSVGLLPDGVAGPRTLAELNKFGQREPVTPPPAPGKPMVERFTVNVVAQIFPATPVKNIRKHLPFVLTALKKAGIADRTMILMALATIRAESEGFEPISEFKSKYNTSPDGHPFDLYDNRQDIGNRGFPDGERYKGRGFIQLTGRANYETHGKTIGLGNKLVQNPDLANDPAIAAKLLASFLKAKERTIKEALLIRDFKAARKAVNGGTHGLTRFEEAFRAGEKLVS